MSLNDFLIQVIRITFALLGFITWVDYIRHRDRTRLDIALLFGALGLVVLIQEFILVTGQRPLWLVKFNQLLLMAHPYLLLQLVEHFQPVPARVQWFALIGMLVSWALLVISPEGSLLLTMALVGYFVVIEVYAAVAFVRGALSTSGVTRRRMWLAATGSGLLATVLLLAGVNAAVPALAAYIGLLIQALAVFAGLAYYLGFAPPRALRQAWQLTELHRFLNESAGKSAEARAAETLPYLCTMATRAVGGRAAAAALWDETQQQLVIRAATQPALSGAVSAHAGAVGRAWQTQQPAFVRTLVEAAPEVRRMAATLDTRAVLAAPIATVEHKWGVLIVLLQRGPLFPNDDMDLLMLFTEQSALALDQTALLNEQKRLLDEQHQLVERLGERTTQLEDANRELEAFSYSVSHDLRAPLRHIEGFTDLLLKSSVVAEKQSHRQLQLITEAAIRMERLIDNLLAFSRLGRSAMAMQPVSLTRLVEEARRELQPETEGRDLVWKVNSLPEVYGDPALLRLVLVNLISNALKYTRPHPQAQIEIGCLTHQPNQVAFYVRDNGVGFDMQYADKLFGVFQRLHHADEFEGLGIGLANVRRIVHRHGGHTWAEGAVGQGATFCVSLPANPEPAVPTPVMDLAAT
ncbi:MAG: sensor histidine kinase [Anaerolineales bacterium]